MRYSTIALAASLLAKDTVLAGTLHGHRVWHGIGHRDLTTEEYVETATVFTTITMEWPGDFISSTSSTEVAVTTSSQAQSVTTTSTAPSVTSTSAAASSSALEAAVFLAKSSSSSSSSSTSSAAQTTLATVAVPTTTTPVVESTTSTTTSAAASATTSTTSSSSGKRGLPYNSASLTDAFLDTSSVTWAYNWDSKSNGLSSKLDYIPMLWGLGSDFVDSWTTNADAAIASGSTALLAMNEPDLAAQSDLSYTDAAAGYLKYMQPYAGKALLGSPSVTNGASPMGLTYLKNFVDACDGCTIDFCAIHWYDSASNVEYFKSYMAEAQTACGGKPIWITEFGATGTSAEQATFLDTVIPWMDAQDYIEKYAYFMASDGVLLSGTSLSTIGEAYVSA